MTHKSRVFNLRPMSTFLSAHEAATLLGVKPATLYAYVSRGLIRSEQVGGPTRERRYHGEDVRQLQQKQEQRRNPAKAVQQALNWGAPVLESALTFIAADHLYYRGQDAITLAQTQTFEQVLALLWQMPLDQAYIDWPRNQSDIALIKRIQAIKPDKADKTADVLSFQLALVALASEDMAAHDLRPANVQRTGLRMIALMATMTGAVLKPKQTLAQALAAGWHCKPEHVNLINTALVLCADHELNASAFTARCAASTGASPYQAALAGLAALQGPKHGGHTARVAALWDEVKTPGRAMSVLSARLQRGETLPGFGHMLYANGDPRSILLLDQLNQVLPNSTAMKISAAIAEAILQLTGQHPTIDFALISLTRALKLPDTAALALFALGRSAGWIGHILEQYASGEMIRPRARYVGRSPLPEQAD